MAMSSQAATFGACPANPTAADTVTLGPISTGSGWIDDKSSTVETGYRNGGWAVPPIGSWISPSMGASTSTPYVYSLDDTIVVDVALIDPASIKITGQFMVDNYLDALVVNGVENAAINGHNVWSAPDTIPVTTLGMVGGNNTIGFKVRNDPAELTQTLNAPMGFWTQFTLTANCKPKAVASANPAPVPVSGGAGLLALTAMLAGLGVWRSRKMS